VPARRVDARSSPGARAVVRSGSAVRRVVGGVPSVAYRTPGASWSSATRPGTRCSMRWRAN